MCTNTYLMGLVALFLMLNKVCKVHVAAEKALAYPGLTDVFNIFPKDHPNFLLWLN